MANYFTDSGGYTGYCIALLFPWGVLFVWENGGRDIEMSPIFTGVTINPSERKLLQGLVVQDVNVNKISSASIANILSQLEIDPNYCNVVGVDLVHNIEPHDDQSFCRYLGYNKAVLVVSSVKRLNKEYMDSPITSFIYTKRDGFLNIFSNKAYPFNPKKEHAMLVNGRVKGFVIFYK